MTHQNAGVAGFDVCRELLARGARHDDCDLRVHRDDVTAGKRDRRLMVGQSGAGMLLVVRQQIGLAAGCVDRQ